jgi:hypothetical protein
LGAKIPKFARKKTPKFGSNEVAIFLARKQKNRVNILEEFSYVA